ncbi:MAG: hypothetical protein PHR25_04430 [Clostridia bacterium]|nr:hypothetical protein [Clostridia bacterium]MDD4376010.1 hypothetical protein [Clostridia bacterium]
MENLNTIAGESNLTDVYPGDIPYNVFIIGKKAFHNFKNTDKKVKEILEKQGYECIDVSQGYANCSVAIIDEKSCVTSDINIAKALIDADIEVLFVVEQDIKLLKRTNSKVEKQNSMFFEYSDMQGFIGGAMATFGDTVVIFGDIENFFNKEKIIKFIEARGKKIKYFEKQEIIDYGGVITLN